MFPSLLIGAAIFFVVLKFVISFQLLNLRFPIWMTFYKATTLRKIYGEISGILVKQLTTEKGQYPVFSSFEQFLSGFLFWSKF